MESNEIDKYINSLQGEFKEICKNLREVILSADKDLDESVKWGRPVYSKNGLICGFSAFKNHVGLNFFNGALINDKYDLLKSETNAKSMRSIKFTNINSINKTAIKYYVKESVKNNASGISSKNKKEQNVIHLPDEILLELKKDKTALKLFNKLSYTHKKEYINWIQSAKKEETKLRRLSKLNEMIKSKN